MLKRGRLGNSCLNVTAAAFGRLCVETILHRKQCKADLAAAFGRLCVETLIIPGCMVRCIKQPPSGGCVLKLVSEKSLLAFGLAAAFGRLCVETTNPFQHHGLVLSSRLRAAVC